MNARQDYGPRGCCGPEVGLVVASLTAAAWWPPAVLAAPAGVLAHRAVLALRRRAGGAR